MRSTGRLFAGLTAFFLIVAIVYWRLSDEPAGSAALVFTTALGGLIAFYLLFTNGRLGPLPEDSDDGDIEEGAGEYGFFSPHSWWPLPVAASCVLVGLGLIFGVWLVAIGVTGLIVSVAGLLFEYYYGEFARD
jgi:hypothetical protein